MSLSRWDVTGVVRDMLRGRDWVLSTGVHIRGEVGYVDARSGHGDWRYPSLEELCDLLNRSRFEGSGGVGCVDASLFPGMPYWVIYEAGGRYFELNVGVYLSRGYVDAREVNLSGVGVVLWCRGSSF